MIGLSAVPARAQTAQDIYGNDIEFTPGLIRLDLSLGSGARALGMGGAFLARADDASAASWNPAGVSYLRVPELSIAGALVSARTEGVDLERGTLGRSDHLRAIRPDFVAGAHPFDVGSVSGAVQLSFQRVVPLGGRRDVTSGDRRIKIATDGGFDVLAASAAARIGQMRLGVSLNHWNNGYDSLFQRFNVNRADVETKMTLSGWNMNLGMIWSPWENFNLGGVFKTPFDCNASLLRSRTDFVEDLELPTPKAQQRRNLVVEFPASFGVGASWRISNPMTVSVDLTRTFWSDARIRHYFDLGQFTGIVEVQDPLPFPLLTATQEDSEQIRVGLEYVLFVKNAMVPLRAGYFNDRQYYQSDDGSVPRFSALTAGTGVAVGDVLFDVAYVRERGRYRNGFPYTTTSHRLFASLIFRPGR